MKLNDTDSLNATDYAFAGFYNAPPFNAWFWTSWYDPILAEELGVHIDWPGYTSLGRGYVHASKDTYGALENFLKKKLEENDYIFFETLSRRIDAEAEKTLSWVESVQNLHDYARNIRGIKEHFHRITFYWALGYFLGVVFDETLRKKAEELGIPSGEISNYVGQPITPLQKRQRDVYALINALNESKVEESTLRNPEALLLYITEHEQLHESFMKHVADYPWIGLIGFLGERLTLRKLVEQIVTYTLTENDEAHTKLHNEQFEAFANVAHNLLYVNQIGAEYFPIFGEKSIAILESVAREVGVSREELLLVLPNELFEGDSIHKDVRRKIEARRSRNIVVYLGSDRQVHCIDDSEKASKLLAEFMPAVLSGHDTVTVKGNIGNKGIVRGTVRVILSTYEQNKMQPRDVLVTSMTTPDFVPLMQKSCAIVTDLGGLLCHAVIMSRELKKPCIVGTKNATQVFKDGDIVEVDADRGVVTILRRASEV